MRAKFRVNHITDGGHYKRLDMSAVTGHQGEIEENKRFWTATPTGHLEMTVNNLPAVEGMKPGDEYYLDFTKAPA